MLVSVYRTRTAGRSGFAVTLWNGQVACTIELRRSITLAEAVEEACRVALSDLVTPDKFEVVKPEQLAQFDLVKS